MQCIEWREMFSKVVVGMTAFTGGEKVSSMGSGRIESRTELACHRVLDRFLRSPSNIVG